MRKTLITLALLLAATGLANAQQEVEIQTCCGQTDPAAAAAESLRETFANYQFQEVRETEVDGLFEVIAEQNILYYAPASGHLIFGEIWDKDGVNLTAQSRQQQANKLITELPLDKAIKIGNGPNQVIEFSNPDCGYCRRSSEFFKDRTDATRYVFLVSFGNEDSAAKSRFILAAEDQAKAYQEIMAGRFDGRPIPSAPESARQLLAKHQQIAAALGVRGTPYFWINGTQVRGANFPQLTSLLEGS